MSRAFPGPLRRQTRPAAGGFLVLVLFGVALGCREDVPALFRRNARPETTLTIVPEDSAQGFYRYHVYWHGADSDGRVVRYIFSISDTLAHDDEDNWDPRSSRSIPYVNASKRLGAGIRPSQVTSGCLGGYPSQYHSTGRHRAPAAQRRLSSLGGRRDAVAPRSRRPRLAYGAS